MGAGQVIADRKSPVQDDRDLVDAIHDGVLETPTWRSFLALLEQRLECRFAVIIPRWPTPGDQGVFITPRPHPESFAAFSAGLASRDPLLWIPKGKAVVYSHMLPGGKMEEDDYYQQMLKPFGMIDMLAMDVAEPESGLLIRLRCARVEGQRLFSEEDRLLVQQLEPRLRASLRIRARLLFQDYQSSANDEASDHLSVGSFILNEKRHIILSNSFAQKVLSDQRGFYRSGNMLHCTSRRDDKLLQDAMQELLAHEPAPGESLDKSLVVGLGSNEPFWSVLLRRNGTPPTVEANAAAALIVVIKAGGTPAAISPEFLTELFELTHREAELAIQLMHGESLYDAADALGITRGTARVHLRAIFAKTGTQRQGQLMVLLMNAAQAIWT